jgi:hypothetical protein
LAAVTVDLRELESERSNLSTFLRSKIQGEITIDGMRVVVDTGEERLSPREVKTSVKRFLHSRGFSTTYRVTVEQGLVRVSRRRQEKDRKVKKGTPPPPHQTMPFYFPQAAQKQISPDL